MKKVATMLKIENADIDKAKAYLAQQYQVFDEKYNEVLKLAFEQYLGREFELCDAYRFRIDTIQGTNENKLYADDNFIGTIRNIVTYSDDDFIKNRVSFLVSFTPELL